MKTRRKNVSKDRHLTYGEGNLGPIPSDLFFEILLRLPAKSIARFRCVSKFWSSILVRQDFTELFVTKASSRPQILFIFKASRELIFFSTPQRQNPHENSFPLVARFLMKIPFERNSTISSHVRGLVLLSKSGCVICNPSTRQSAQVKTAATFAKKNFLGYDPVDKLFKVLFMNFRYCRYHSVSKGHQVLTLGNGEESWRKIKCCVPHYPLSGGICIDGVLYYLAAISMGLLCSMVVCFDVRSEKFSSVKVSEYFVGGSGFGILINYNGKLGWIESYQESGFITRRTKGFKIWILEDIGEGKWSERTYVIPTSCRDMFGDKWLRIAGVTRRNEIVLSRLSFSANERFYVLLYYNMERSTVVRVEIQGMEAFNGNAVETFLDHVEDVKLMQMFQVRRYNLRSCNKHSLCEASANVLIRTLYFEIL